MTSTFRQHAVTCPTDGGRGASLLHWAATDTKVSPYGRQEHTTEMLHGGIPVAVRQIFLVAGQGLGRMEGGWR